MLKIIEKKSYIDAILIIFINITYKYHIIANSYSSQNVILE